MFGLGATNLVPIVPALVLMRMTASGAAATAQFNAGADTAMDLWALWLIVWLVSMLAMVGAFAAALVLAAVIFRQGEVNGDRAHNARVPLFALLAGTVAHLGVMFIWIGENFPTA